MLAEVFDLADLAGMRTYVAWAHPRLVEVVASRDASVDEGSAMPHAAPAAAPSRTSAASLANVSTGGMLTPKEARILALLAVGRANKEIARAMDIGEQTVKWHLKNLFFKLNAGSRKHAVDRARLLGLLEG